MNTNNNLPTLPNGRTITLLADNAQWTNRFMIPNSNGTREYTVAQRKGGEQGWACSCPGWIRWRHCKHLRALQPALRALEQRKQAARIG